MRRKTQLWTGFAVFVVLLLVAFFPGCAKKGTMKNVTTVSREQKPVVQIPARAAKDDKKIREETLREQALREQELREQRLKDSAAREKAPESAKGETADSELAILNELQIPDIHFAFDEYNLKPEDQAVLKTGARAYLKQTKYKLVIEGHCDERGTIEYNLALGQKRADEAAKFFIDLGMAKERIKTISYGEERPLDLGHDETALAKNRRDHFVPTQP